MNSIASSNRGYHTFPKGTKTNWYTDCEVSDGDVSFTIKVSTDDSKCTDASVDSPYINRFFSSIQSQISSRARSTVRNLVNRYEIEDDVDVSVDIEED